MVIPSEYPNHVFSRKSTEYSIATTSQMIDIKTGGWCDEIFEKLDLPKRLTTDIVKPGTIIGTLTDGVCEECGVDKVPVVAVCEHDTQSAITAVPCPEGDFAFLSSGTWSLFGTELAEPIVNEKTLGINITNEGGYGDSTGFLKNIIGLWLIQESRRQFAREGTQYSYAELEKLALAAEPFACFIDPDAPEFVPHGDIPGRVKEYCRRTGQYVPETVGEIMRCIYESLAMKYRLTFEKLRDCTERDYEVIHVIGGGTKDTLLCRLTANACARKVVAGPIEATVLGNIAVQLLASGDIKSIEEARRIVAASEGTKEYLPEDTETWAEHYKRFLQVTQ